MGSPPFSISRSYDPLPVTECRQIQDAAFLLRRDGPRVPGFFYRLRRTRSSTSTQALLDDAADSG
ncbi:S-4TM family putative pore-forming effector [Nonomuraea sp. NPDC049141]|uniref:S-4TM family putative pore-forming effector n=1 Tax=Nonomuraea sp. NPDC049141 TaxID=3155500 RepID=UPI0033D64709